MFSKYCYYVRIKITHSWQNKLDCLDISYLKTPCKLALLKKIKISNSSSYS